MIEKIKEYTYLIVISVFITNMIQLIAPKGSTRKYIIFFAGIIVTIVLIEPIINLLNQYGITKEDFFVKKTFSISQTSSASNNSLLLKLIFKSSLVNG